MDKMDYIKLLNCEKEEELHQAISLWSSDSTIQDKVIKCSILDLHASVESAMKEVLYQALYSIMPYYENDESNQKNLEDLQKTIEKYSFFNTHSLLKFGFKAFGLSETDNLTLINKCRNQVAHGDIEKVNYKGRNPFKDSNCYAQFFMDCWAVKKTIIKFKGRMILDPRAKLADYEKESQKSLSFDGETD